MSEPMPFAKIRLSLMFAAEHELPIELGTDEVWSVLNKLDQLSAETGKAIARADTAERELAALRERTRWIPFNEQRPPEDESRYTARTFGAGGYWAWLPDLPEEE